MTTKNYLIIENNLVTNNVVWDGDTQTWIPPVDSIQIIQATTPAMIWVLNSDKTNYVLEEVIGFGEIGFTWDGSILTTNETKPLPPKPKNNQSVPSVTTTI